LTRIRDVLDQLLGRAHVQIEARFDPAREPESDTPRMFGSPAKLVEATGWSASWPLGETLADLLESWRQRLL
jgi:GDP-4-dehydro-6-deoxy-D-mannose reductase